MKDIDLLAFGNPCADFVVSTARVPAWDDKCIGQARGLFAGGVEANVACAASRLGLVSAAFGAVGDDANGAFLGRAFVVEGVLLDYLVTREGRASATAIILVSPEGERSIVWVPLKDDGPRESLDAAVARSRIVYAMPYDVAPLVDLHALTARHGTRLAIDVEREGVGVAGHFERLLSACDIAFLNESGFIAATGRPPSESSLRQWRTRFDLEAIVVTLGGRGAIAADRGGSASHPAFAATVVDATGAGDSFNAAFLHARLAGLALTEGLAFACAAASHSVAAMGARSGLPTLTQVEAVLRSHPRAAH